MMDIKLKIKRFSPERGNYISEYHVETEGSSRVIDSLEQIARNADPTLAFRRSCIHGVCGSDAMRINGVEMLACKALFKDVATEDNQYTVDIEPLKHLPLSKDLLVNQQLMFDKYKKVQPYFIPAEKVEDACSNGVEKEYSQTPEQLELIDKASTCIACGACISACPVVEENPEFLGPMALVQAARFVYDSRDQGLSPRLEALNHPNGVWSCDNMFECTKVCPQGIPITKLINQMKRSIKKLEKQESNASSIPLFVEQ